MAGSEYYDHTTYPANGAQGSSSAMRAELNTIETGFGKLIPLSGNANKLMKVNSGATGHTPSIITDDGSTATVTGALTATGNVTGLNLSGTNTGDQTITLTGDVTGTGTGSFAATIANDAVTYAKIQNVVSDQVVLGNIGGAGGIVSELTASDIRTLINVENGSTADQSDAEIKTAYENNANTNAYTDSEKTIVGNTSGTNTGDEVSATTTVEGVVERATQAEVDAGTDTSRYVTPETLAKSLTARSVGGNSLAPHSNLVVDRTGNTTVDIDADEVMLKDTNNVQYIATSVNLTADITTLGAANGLDTGSETSSTWYYLWVIYNGTTVASLLSLSSTAPTMPGGYTYKGLVGAVYNDGSSNFLEFDQYGSKANLRAAANDLADTTPSTTQVAITLTAPPDTIALFTAIGNNTTGTTVLFVDDNFIDVVPSVTNANFAFGANSGQEVASTSLEVRTNASSQINYRSSASSVISFQVNTRGWRFE